MTGDTLMDEKTPQSPTSPTDTEATFTGDAIIEIGEDRSVPMRPSSLRTHSSGCNENAQPRR
jgi:hypothetical protein